MDPRFSFIKRSPVILMTLGIGLLAFLFLGPSLTPSAGKHGRFLASGMGNHWSFSKIVEEYGQAWVSLQEKVRAIRHAEEENSKLRLENAHLKLGLEALQFSCNARSGGDSTHQFELKLNKETGSIAGRTLAGLMYHPPVKLLPSQLYTLGISYLKAHEDEKVAVIFTNLTGLEDTQVYRTPKNFLITAVAWYRLENYVLADYYFDQVLKAPEEDDSIAYQAQARLWKAVLAKRIGKEVKTQFWLKELIDHHPYSAESGWVNTAAEVRHEKPKLH